MSEKLARISGAEAQAPLIAGMEMTDTTITVGVIDKLGRSLSQARSPRRPKMTDEQVALSLALALGEAVEAANDLYDTVSRVGLTAPTPFSPAVVERLGTLVALPVTQVNYLDALSAGERWLGAARDFSSLVLLTVGDEIGCGIYLSDTPIGEAGRGGEFQHSIVDFADDARVCRCGSRGHLAAYASGAAVVEQAREAVTAKRKTKLAGSKELTFADVVAAGAAGDAVALEIIDRAAMYLGIGLVNLMHTVDTSGILLHGPMTFGGPQSELGCRWLEKVRKSVAERAFALLVEKTKIDFALLGSDGGYLGAATAARQ